MPSWPPSRLLRTTGTVRGTTPSPTTIPQTRKLIELRLLSPRYLIRMRPEVQVLPGPPPLLNSTNAGRRVRSPLGWPDTGPRTLTWLPFLVIRPVRPRRRAAWCASWQQRHLTSVQRPGRRRIRSRRLQHRPWRIAACDRSRVPESGDPPRLASASVPEYDRHHEAVHPGHQGAGAQGRAPVRGPVPQGTRPAGTGLRRPRGPAGQGTLPGGPARARVLCDRRREGAGHPQGQAGGDAAQRRLRGGGRRDHDEGATRDRGVT